MYNTKLARKTQRSLFHHNLRMIVERTHEPIADDFDHISRVYLCKQKQFYSSRVTAEQQALVGVKQALCSPR